MPLVIPERTVEYPGHDYGMKVLDPVDGKEIFNAKYPIFGSDITNPTDQIISRRVTVTNSSGAFSEPATPTINWVNDGQWKNMVYTQMNNVLMATIPHGQGKVPQFMVTGSAFIRRTMRLRYWHRDQNGSMTYNTAYNADGGFRSMNISPRMNGAEYMLPYPTGFEFYQFSNVGPYTSPVGMTPGKTSISITADDTNIYIRGTMKQTLNYQRLRDTQFNFGWDRYEKYWMDMSGSWYDFTIYILPYDKSEDIYIR